MLADTSMGPRVMLVLHGTVIQRASAGRRSARVKLRSETSLVRPQLFDLDVQLHCDKDERHSFLVRTEPSLLHILDPTESWRC